MTTNQIKAFFVARGLSLLDVAAATGEHYSEIWRVVNYERENQRLRKKLKRKYRGLKFNPFQERKAA
jgi:hypothetical protein